MSEPAPIVDVLPVSAPIQAQSSLVELTSAPMPVVVDDTVKPMPVWLSLIVIILSLGAGGWIIKWYVGTDMLAHETRILDENPPEAPGRPGMAGPPVQQQGTSWIIRCPEATLLIAEPPLKPARVRSMNYSNYQFVPADERKLIFSARRIQRDAATTKNLGVTPDQLKQFRALEQQITMATAPADLDRLLSLWAAYQSAKDKTLTLAALQSAMTDIARKSVPGTKALAAERAAKIRAVLSAEQWQRFEAMGR